MEAIKLFLKIFNFFNFYEFVVFEFNLPYNFSDDGFKSNSALSVLGFDSVLFYDFGFYY